MENLALIAQVRGVGAKHLRQNVNGLPIASCANASPLQVEAETDVPCEFKVKSVDRQN